MLPAPRETAALPVPPPGRSAQEEVGLPERPAWRAACGRFSWEGARRLEEEEEEGRQGVGQVGEREVYQEVAVPVAASHLG